MQFSYRLGTSTWLAKGASQRRSVLGHDVRASRCIGVECRAVNHGDKEKSQQKVVSPKINAALLAVLPMLTALPAGANEIQHYLQLATPGLAIVIGSLAYAAAAPAAIRKNLFTTEKRPSIEQISLDEILEAEYPPAPGKPPLFPKIESDGRSVPSPTATTPPAQTVAAFAAPTSILAEEVTRETDAHAPHVADEAGISYLGEGKEILQGRGRSMLMAFAGAEGRSGSLSQGAVVSSIQANPLLRQKGTLHNEQAAEVAAPVNKAKELVSHVMEWTGLDAREMKKEPAENKLQGNVVPLHKSADYQARELVSLNLKPRGEAKMQGADGKETELSTIAVVATLPTAAVSTIAETPIRSTSQLQAEHKEKIDSLMSQVASIKAVAITPAAALKTAPAKTSQEEYDIKMNALKQSTTQKQRSEELRPKQRADPDKKLSQATQDRLQEVKPYSALATTDKPQGLAKLHPKALIASLVETMMAMWNMVLRAARKLTGQDPPAPQLQT